MTYQAAKQGALRPLGRGEHYAVEYWPVVMPQLADWLKERGTGSFESSGAAPYTVSVKGAVHYLQATVVDIYSVRPHAIRHNPNEQQFSKPEARPRVPQDTEDVTFDREQEKSGVSYRHF